MPSSTSSIPDCSGKVIDGRYRLTDVIGTGSFGIVYEAIDESIEGDDDAARSVAVKIMDKSNKRLHDGAYLRMEIALHKRASLLPRVVTLRAAPEDDGYAYLVMDLCRGGSLGQYIERHGPYMDGEKLRRTFLAIVDAVADLHRAGIYHRDIKPGNILLSEDGEQVFLGDFGLATRSERYSYCAGTRAYMPPELLDPKFNARPSSAQSDVWALGVVLLNMLSGRVPWASACTLEAGYFDFVRDPRHLLRDDYFPVSPGLNRIVRRMLRQNPAIRMTLAEVRAAVAELDVLLREVVVPLTEREVDIGEGGMVVGAGMVVGEKGKWRAEPKGNEKEKERERESVRVVPVRKSAEVKEVPRSTAQCEMDIVAAQRARKEAVRRRHALAPNTAAKAAARKCGGGSEESSSAKSSTMAVTPGDSDVVVEKKDIGERMREIVARVKFKFRYR
ncbi:transporter [Ganoderma sinense ZZ0214-1]|uniref:Transporter n=1 Tax=Ganoderma sinense ZZ0214-1 TaxID=1077348 RepID=A0A2G8SMZ3_9APHY|nr:transporter [Ganoderma sinense ZZ0214-1]